MVYNSSRIQEMCAHSSADRVPGYEPVGRRFKSCWARHEKGGCCKCKLIAGNSLFPYAKYAYLSDEFCLRQ